MATYVPLHSVPATATADTTGQNTGNWTIAYPASLTGLRVPYAEISALFVNGPIGFGFALYIAGKGYYTASSLGSTGGTSWNPSNPPIITPGDDFYLFWMAAISVTPAPTATVWFRADIDIPANRANAPGGVF